MILRHCSNHLVPRLNSQATGGIRPCSDLEGANLKQLRIELPLRYRQICKISTCWALRLANSILETGVEPATYRIKSVVLSATFFLAGAARMVPPNSVSLNSTFVSKKLRNKLRDMPAEHALPRLKRILAARYRIMVLRRLISFWDID